MGKKYEDLAERYLIERGYEIVGKNLNFHKGELDLIALEKKAGGDVLVFVEVRKRDSRSFEAPEESLSPSKQRRLFYSIDRFLMGWKGRAHELRIDLIAFSNEEIRHYPNFLEREYG